MGGGGRRTERGNNHSLPCPPQHLGFCGLCYAFSTVLFPDWSLTLYNNSVCTSRYIHPSLNLFCIHCLFPEVDVNKTAHTIQVQHGLKYVYIVDSWYSKVMVALEPSFFSASQTCFIFDLKECWAENYHNLRSNNWMLTISSGPGTLHINTLFCICIAEFCLFFFLTQLLNFSESVFIHVTQKKCVLSTASNSSHSFTLAGDFPTKSFKTVNCFLDRVLDGWKTTLFFLNSFGFPLVLFWHFLDYRGVFWYLNAYGSLVVAIC